MAPDKDDQLVAQIAKSVRNEERIAWSMLAMLAIWAGIFLGALKFHLPIQGAGMAAFAVLLTWIGFVFHWQRSVPPASAGYDEEMLRKTIDDQHRRWRWQFVFLFLFIAGVAVALSFAFLLPDAANAPTAKRLLVRNVLVLTWMPYLVVLAVMAAFQVCFGPPFSTRAIRRALNDELTRALQGHAATFGYLLSVIAMCLAMATGAINPQWGIAALPGAIAAAVILPGLYFLVLQWRAGRDG